MIGHDEPAAGSNREKESLAGVLSGAEIAATLAAGNLCLQAAQAYALGQISEEANEYCQRWAEQFRSMAAAIAEGRETLIGS